MGKQNDKLFKNIEKYEQKEKTNVYNTPRG